MEFQNANGSLQGLMSTPTPPPSLMTLSLSVLLSPAEAPPSGMSKNGYFFQEMGESESPAGWTHFSTWASFPQREKINNNTAKQ